MNTSKYLELEEVSRRDAEAFQQYEADCRDFIVRLRQSLITYLGCTPDRIVWLPFSETESPEQRRANKVIELTLDRRMALQGDATYQFILRVNLEANSIDVPSRIKKIDHRFLIKMAKESYEVPKDSLDEIDRVAERLVVIVKKFLDTRFSDFVNGKPSTFGFLGTRASSLPDE